ncbi:MAG: PadR family transcriptional regulator [Anaerolineae bacterium]|nr:PadR family transcriptional regulator [Anaerolineae bacterium]
MSLPHMLLGLLEEGSMSGYELNKAIHDSIRHFWTTDQSQIYRALHKMEADGWLRVETVIQADSPNKKVYHLTEAGREALAVWLRTPLVNQPLREAWLAQIFFGSAIPTAETIRLVEGYRKGVAEGLAALEELQARLPAAGERAHVPRRYQYQLLTLDYGMAYHRSMLATLDAMLEQMKLIAEVTE